MSGGRATRHCRSCAHWKPQKKNKEEEKKNKKTRKGRIVMNLSRDKLSISEEPIAHDPYGRPIFVFTRTDNCKEIVVTKVKTNERSFYVSFGIHWNR